MKKSLLFIFSIVFLTSCTEGVTSSNNSLSTEITSHSSELISSNNVSISSTPLSQKDYSEALKKSQGSQIAFDGDVSMYYEEFQESFKVMKLNNHFKEDIVLLSKYYYGDDSQIISGGENYIFKKDDGLSYNRYISINNTVEDSKVLDENNGEIIFENRFSNPLKGLTYNDFIFSQGFAILKPNKRDDVACKILQERISVSKISFAVTKEGFSHVTIQGNSGLDSLGFNSNNIYELDINYNTNVELPNYKPYEHLSFHTKIDNALTELRNSLKEENYTLKINYSDLNGTLSSAETRYYSTKDYIYCDAKNEDGISFGFKKENDKLYQFTYNQETLSIDNSVAFNEQDIRLNFNFASELFAKETNTEYYSRTNFVSLLTRLITPVMFREYYASTCYDLALNIDSNDKFISFVLSYSDMSSISSGKIIMTFENIASTIIPII